MHQRCCPMSHPKSQPQTKCRQKVAFLLILYCGKSSYRLHEALSGWFPLPMLYHSLPVLPSKAPCSSPSLGPKRRLLFVPFVPAPGFFRRDLSDFGLIHPEHSCDFRRAVHQDFLPYLLPWCVLGHRRSPVDFDGGRSPVTYFAKCAYSQCLSIFGTSLSLTAVIQPSLTLPEYHSVLGHVSITALNSECQFCGLR